jgi:tubby-related protein 1
VPGSSGINGPRNVEVILPPLTEEECFQKIDALESGKSALLKRKKEGQPVITLISKEPVWCEETGSYVLNFDGRVAYASIKNFQLVHPRDRTRQHYMSHINMLLDEYVVEVFGKMGDNNFSLDFKYPLTYAIALGIAMTNFDE